jgi:hypothetical protein
MKLSYLDAEDADADKLEEKIDAESIVGKFKTVRIDNLT